jgi:hypothetical protein
MPPWEGIRTTLSELKHTKVSSVLLGMMFTVCGCNLRTSCFETLEKLTSTSALKFEMCLDLSSQIICGQLPVRTAKATLSNVALNFIWSHSIRF